MKISEDLLRLIAAAGRGEVIEVSRLSGWHELYDLDELLSSYHVGSELRIKSKTITLAGVKFPEPLRVAPELGTDIWVVFSPCNRIAFLDIWRDVSFQKPLLKRGGIQATEQGAKDQAKAMILSVGGSLE